MVSKASRLPWPPRTVQGTGPGAASPVPGTSLLLQACFPAVHSETRTEQRVSLLFEKILNVYSTLLPFLISAGSKPKVLFILKNQVLFARERESANLTTFQELKWNHRP